MALFLIAVVVSLVIAYATGGFWIKIKPTLDQPKVHYTHDALLLFEVRVHAGCRVILPRLLSNIR